MNDLLMPTVILGNGGAGHHGAGYAAVHTQKEKIPRTAAAWSHQLRHSLFWQPRLRHQA